jgi:hypothetical protein
VRPRLLGFLAAAVSLLAPAAAAAATAPVRFFADTRPPARGQQVRIDLNPSQDAPQTESPNSIAFYLPAHWQYDGRAVKAQCTPAQAAAVSCPQESWIGFGHVVTAVWGYLCPGGGTDAVAYMNAFAGPPTQPGDLASMVIEVELLSTNPLINDLNQFFGMHIRNRYSVIGRVLAVHSGRFGLEVSFSGIPGAIAVPQPPFCPGLTAQVTRFKLLVGVVRRVKKPTVHRITVQTLSGPKTETIHDHVLVGYHLLKRPFNCPSSGSWPWQVVVGFPQGPAVVAGSAACSTIHSHHF